MGTILSRIAKGYPTDFRLASKQKPVRGVLVRESNEGVKIWTPPNTIHSFPKYSYDIVGIDHETHEDVELLKQYEALKNAPAHA